MSDDSSFGYVGLKMGGILYVLSFIFPSYEDSGENV